ncbi:hypothetical protein D9M68_706940 [compost metagenome]
MQGQEQQRRECRVGQQMPQLREPGHVLADPYREGQVPAIPGQVAQIAQPDARRTRQRRAQLRGQLPQRAGNHGRLLAHVFKQVPQ